MILVGESFKRPGLDREFLPEEKNVKRESDNVYKDLTLNKDGDLPGGAYEFLGLR
jgi:hypothetical protein